MRFLSLLVLMAVMGGCARYEYNIVAPENLRGHIGEKTDHTVAIEPLTYRLRSMDNRLVVRIYNETNDPILLVGERSTAVTPDGQSHPMRPQTIAPGSFIKLIFPPVKPQLPPSGPVFGIGIGTRVDAGVIEDEPRYLSAYNPDDTIFWDWDGQTDVEATFVYRRADKEFQHRFVLHRQKM